MSIDGCRLCTSHNWIIRRQLGRRDASEDQKSYYRGKLYHADKQERGGDRKSKGHNAPLKSTAEKLAEEYDVDPATIKRDAKYANAVDTIAKNVGKKAREAILSGETKDPTPWVFLRLMGASQRVRQ